MSFTKIIAVLVIVIVVAFGSYYFLKSDKPLDSTSIQSNEENENIENVGQTDGKKMAFTQFAKQGGSYKCTVHQYVNGTDTIGTAYINNGMIRGEYNIQVQGLNISTSLIVKDGYTYSWSSMAPTMGVKAKVTGQAVSDANAGVSGTYSFNTEQIGDYDCEQWTVDNSMFVLPQGVTFREV